MKILRLARLLLLPFAIAVITTTALGQTPANGGAIDYSTLSEEEYQNLKANGLLPGSNMPVEDYTTPPPGAPSYYIPGGPQPKINITCQPLVPVDNTFQVARFTNGSPPLYRNDDGSTNLISIPFTFTFYGVNYNGFYINNNGNITFNGQMFTFSANGFPFAGNVMIAPFWADVDTRNAASGVVYYKVTPTYAIIRWNNVGYYSSMADKRNDFQLIITNGSDPILPVGTNVQMAYGDMQWTTGSASGGTNGFGGTPANVGANLGNGTNFIQFGRFNQNNGNYDGPFAGNDGINWLDNRALYFDVSDPLNSNNVAPIANGIAACDTVDMCQGDTLNFNFSFLSPEQGQITTISINNVPGFVLNTVNNANNATATATFIATSASVGLTSLKFMGTDNGTPNVTTTVEYIVNILPRPQKPIITGDSVLCPNEATTLQTQAGYTNYVWSNAGSVTNSIPVSTAGTFTVSYDSLTCTNTSDPFTVISVPNPVPTHSAPLSSCNSGTAVVIAAPGYSAYSWTPDPSVNDTVNLLPGLYTLTVTDTNNCVGSIPVNINLISSISLSLVDTTSASCAAICNGRMQVSASNYLGSVTYSWLPNVSSTDIAQNLCIGTYMVIATDTAGCDDTLSVDLTSVYEVTTQVTKTDPLCYNSCDGYISITPLTGTAPYNYAWLPNNIIGNTPPGLCAGTYYVTTTDIAGCSTADTIILANPAELRVTATNTKETCPGFCDGTAALNILGGTPGYSILWGPNGETTAAISNLCGGDYTYTVTDLNNCVVTNIIEINTIPKPIAQFSSSAATSDGLSPEVIFVNQSTGDVTQWYWTFENAGQSFDEDPVVDFPGMGQYDVELIVTNDYGCSDTTSSTIEIQDINVLYIPNAFTPNRDGLNDIFLPKGVIANNLDYSLLIFDRWGERIFYTNSIFEGWDGTLKSKECPVDVYLFRIVITDAEAETQKVYTGRVNLVR